MALLQYLYQGSCILKDELWIPQCKSFQIYLLLEKFQASGRKKESQGMIINSFTQMLLIINYVPHSVQGSREKTQQERKDP